MRALLAVLLLPAMAGASDMYQAPVSSPGISTGAATTAALTGNGQSGNPLGVDSSSVAVFDANRNLVLPYGLLVGTISASGSITGLSVTATGTGFLANGGGYPTIYANGSAGGVFGSQTGAAYFDSASETHLRVGGTTRMFIGGSGIVGIGTAAPGATLDVAGNAAFSSGITASSVTSKGGVLANDFAAFYGVNAATATFSSKVIIGASAVGTQALRVVAGRTQLQADSEPYALQIGRDDNSDTGFYLGAPDTTNPANLVFSNNAGTARVTFTDGGSVGIGTASPATTLDVNGNAQFGSGATKSTFTATGQLTVDAAAYITVGGAKMSADLFSSTGNNVYLRAGSGSGNVHINDGSNATTYISESGGAVQILTAAGTQLHYCSGGTYDGHIGRGASMVCTGGTATALGIYVP